MRAKADNPAPGRSRQVPRPGGRAFPGHLDWFPACFLQGILFFLLQDDREWPPVLSSGQTRSGRALVHLSLQCQEKDLERTWGGIYQRLIERRQEVPKSSKMIGSGLTVEIL